MRGGRARGTNCSSMAARPRCFWLVVIAGTAVLARLRRGAGPRLPPEDAAAEGRRGADRDAGSRSAPPKSRRASRARRQRDAERLRPVLEGWAAAVRRGDPDRAARYFAVPAIVAQSMPVELQTREQVRKFNDELPCGARLLEVQHDGRYVVGTFRLTERPGRTCTTAGQLVARRVRDPRAPLHRVAPGARTGRAPRPGPDEPEEAPPPGGARRAA